MSARAWLTCAVVLLLIAVASILPPQFARAASGACSVPSTSYGSDTLSVTVPATGNYYIWSRMSADSTADSNVMMQIDSSACYTVGTSSAKTVPIYANGATTFFANDSTNWLDTDSSGNPIMVSNLTAGTHTITMIGSAPNLVLDRIILTQDGTCIPTGTGDNCASPADTTSPTVSITAPTSGATISTTTTATATASDNVGVTKVEFYVDGSLMATDTSSPYNYSLNPASFTLGSHQLTAKAYDAAGNNTTSTIVNFTVPDTTAPTVSLTAPTNGATVSGTVAASATATDNVGVTKVEFYIDGTLQATSSTPTGNVYAASLSTSSLTNASHTIMAKAYDAAGNTNTSSATVTVSNSPTNDTTPPTISITTPTAGSWLNIDSTSSPYNSKAYAVSAIAADASGIKQVVFSLDGVVKATDTTAPYNYNLDLTTVSCGAHTLTAKATDASTNANTATATASFTATYAADILTTQACHVTYLDLSALASKYGQSGANLGRADINGDGTVNYLDLSALVNKYNK